MTILSAAEVEQNWGWGNHLAFLWAAIIIWAIWRGEMWWRHRHGADAEHSPTETAAPLPVETRRSPASRLTSHDDETRDETDKGKWYGAIVYDARGVGRRVYEKARHIAATGDSPPPGGVVNSADHERAADWLDDVVDDDWTAEENERVVTAPAVVEPDDDEEEELPAARETADEYARRCFAAGMEKALIVQGLQEHYGKARATAYRIAGKAEADAGRVG